MSHFFYNFTATDPPSHQPGHPPSQALPPPFLTVSGALAAQRGAPQTKFHHPPVIPVSLALRTLHFPVAAPSVSQSDQQKCITLLSADVQGSGSWNMGFDARARTNVGGGRARRTSLLGVVLRCRAGGQGAKTRDSGLSISSAAAATHPGTVSPDERRDEKLELLSTLPPADYLLKLRHRHLLLLLVIPKICHKNRCSAAQAHVRWRTANVQPSPRSRPPVIPVLRLQGKGKDGWPLRRCRCRVRGSRTTSSFFLPKLSSRAHSDGLGTAAWAGVVAVGTVGGAPASSEEGRTITTLSCDNQPSIT